MNVEALDGNSLWTPQHPFIFKHLQCVSECILLFWAVVAVVGQGVGPLVAPLGQAVDHRTCVLPGKH